jgi:CDP-glucose 4,6-dehydratase
VANPIGKTLQNLPGPVLITGHTGFKGTWMTLLLQQLGISVIGYSLEPEKDSLYDRANLNGNITEKIGDIRDYKKLEKFIKKYQPSVIIHMAAQPLVLESYRIPLETFNINVMGTANVLDISFDIESVQVVLVVTTDKVYRNDNSGRAFIETDPLEGKDPYSASKVGTEAVVKAWQQITETSDGPKVVSVRAGNVIGGGDFAKNRLIPDIIRSYVSEVPMVIRNPDSTRPWQHVLDPLIGYVKTMEAILAGNTITSINFGPHTENLKVQEVIDLWNLSFNSLRPLETKYVPSEMLLESKTLDINSSYANDYLKWQPRWNQHVSINKTFTWWIRYLNENANPRTLCIEDISAYLNQE